MPLARTVRRNPLAAGGVAGLQDRIELRKKLLAELRFFRFGLRRGLTRFLGVGLSSGAVARGLFRGGLCGGSFVRCLLGLGFSGLLLR